MSWWLSKAGDSHGILFVALVFCALTFAVTRRLRPVVFLVVVMFGELSLFLASAAAVHRPRPPVTQLDGVLPTSSFPSGHVAATTCLYVGIAVIVLARTRAWWRWLTVAAAVLMPLRWPCPGCTGGCTTRPTCSARCCWPRCWCPGLLGDPPERTTWPHRRTAAAAGDHLREPATGADEPANRSTIRSAREELSRCPRVTGFSTPAQRGNPATEHRPAAPADGWRTPPATRCGR